MARAKKNSLTSRVKKIIDERLKPAVAMDGGVLELVSVDERNAVVKVRLGGACVGCPLSGITLSMGIEREIIENIPEVKAVELVT